MSMAVIRAFLRLCRQIVAGALSLVLLVALLIFTLANRHLVPFFSWPLPFTGMMPLYLFVLVPLASGAILGGALVWLHQQTYFRRLLHKQNQPPPAAEAKV
jgi:hypothetical protein